MFSNTFLIETAAVHLCAKRKLKSNKKKYIKKNLTFLYKENKKMWIIRYIKRVDDLLSKVCFDIKTTNEKIQKKKYIHV